MNRRKFLLGLGGCAAVATPLYSFELEPSWFEVTTKKVPVLRGNSGTVRLLHLSDFHASTTVPWPMIEHALSMALEQKPDLICLTGDYVTSRADDLDHYTKILSPLAQAAPTFACLGNHDGGWGQKYYGCYSDPTPLVKMLQAAGIRCLVNEATQITVKDQSINLLGFGDIYTPYFKPDRAIAARDTFGVDGMTLVLSHNPDSKEPLANVNWDLMLCGHTHGGQVKIPFFGAPVLPIRDRRFAEGLVHWNKRWVHVTRGIGNLNGFRFNCPPEISILELVPSSSTI